MKFYVKIHAEMNYIIQNTKLNEWHNFYFKYFISKLKNIPSVASVRISNLTHVRIAMTSPIQSKAMGLLPC